MKVPTSETRGARLRRLFAGRSIRWVADQLGHANPELTVRVYAHALPVEEQDFAFADFGGAEDGTKRLYTAPGSERGLEDESPAAPTTRRGYENLEHETGLEPATPTLATWRSTN